MNKLDKPKFLKHSSFIDIIGIIGFIVSIVQFLIPEKILSIKYKICVFILTFIFCLIIYLIQYIVNWHKLYKNYLKFYKDYQGLKERHLALSEEFNKKQQLISSKDNLILQYQFVIEKISNNISDGILPVTDYEKEYLKNLYSIVLKDKIYLYNLGGNENGRKNL